MAGFNLPPGCNVSDIPGAVPTKEEAFYETLYTIFDDLGLDEAIEEKIVERLTPLISKAQQASYTDGSGDTLMGIEEPLESLLGARDISEIPPDELINALGNSKHFIDRIIVGLAKRIK